MPNKNYRKGRAKEYRLMNKLKKEGYDIVFRTAGSHSAIDIVGINKKNKSIKFIQAKPKRFSKNKKGLLEKENEWLNNKFNAQYEVL